MLNSVTFLIFFLFISNTGNAQYSDRYEPAITRILFLLDGSGSMKEEWDGNSKFSISKDLIINLLDSLQRVDTKIEFAIRVFGHQSHRSMKNCTDSKLEINFGRHNPDWLRKDLDKITPQGWTPIAYSLKLAANDFPKDADAKNAIILITDGLETCGGDPCATGKALQDNRVSLRPFVIGLGLGEDKKDYFDCVGRYFDASTAVSFKRILNTVISQTLNTTTAQINLINEFGKPTETNIEISLLDSYSGKLLYNFIHTLDDTGNPDTLRLDPVGKYDVQVHTIPSVIKLGVELTPGTNNIIAINTPQGILKLTEGSLHNRASKIQCVITPQGSVKTLYVQGFGTEQKYLTGIYDLKILTLPVIEKKGVQIKQSQVEEVNIPSPGTLNLTATQEYIVGVYLEKGEEITRIYEIKNIIGQQLIKLQPGVYKLLHRPKNHKSNTFTRTEEFEIRSGVITTIRI